MINKIKEHDKLLYLFSMLLFIGSLFSAFSIKSVHADWGAGAVSDCVSGCYVSNLHWERQNIRSKSQEVYTSRGWMSIERYFQLNNFTSSMLNDFLNAEDQFMIVNGGFKPIGVLTWNVDTHPLDKFPGLSQEQSARARAMMKSKVPGFQHHPLVAWGLFGETKKLCTGSQICVCNTGSGPKVTYSSSTQKDNTSITGEYSYYIQITPVKPVGFENLSAEEKTQWYATHQTQRSSVKLTEFGTFVRNFNFGSINGQSGSDSAWNNFVSQAQRLATKDINDTLELNEANKKGFQRGGVFTISTMVKRVTISASTTTQYKTTYDCVDKGNGTTQYQKVSGPVAVSKTISNPKFSDTGGNSSTSNSSFININSNTGYTPKTSYQIMNVRCNRDLFNRVVARTNSKNISYGSGSASTAQSPIVKYSTATFYNNLDINFFYGGQDCDFKCSATPTGQSAGPNDASANVQNRGNNQSKYGAQTVDGNSNDKFSFFRDNVSHETRLDVWHPNSLNSDVTYNQDTPAFKTTVTLDTSGTPKGELFRLLDDSNSILIDGKNMTNVASKTLDRQLNRLNWQASYSSEKGKEHKVNVHYAYKVKIKTTVPIPSTNGVNSSVVVDTENLDISCTNTYNTTEPTKATIYGTPAESGYKPKTSFDKANNKYLTVGFVKSSAE